MNRDPVLMTMYGKQPLSRMIRYYRTLAHTPDSFAAGSNRRIAHQAIRSLIGQARQVQA